MAEVPLTPQKVAFKLHDIRHRLDVEIKLKAGSEKMALALLHDTHRLAEVQDRVKDCNARVGLLQKAELKYKNLLVEDDESVESVRSLSTGTLKVHVGHLGGLGRRREYSLVIKVDGAVKATTRATKGGKWNDVFGIGCEKASEVEVCVVEKGVSVAVMWFMISQLEEAVVLRKHAESEGKGEGKEGIQEVRASDFPGTLQSDGRVESIFELEPTGKIQMGFNFIANQKSVRQGITRQRNVQKIFPKRGHKFTLQQFYQVVKCAACSEFLISGQGFQCASKFYLTSV